jgi:TolB-like protein
MCLRHIKIYYTALRRKKGRKYMKKISILIMLCLYATTVFAQAKPTLAILPFTGGRNGEGDTLAELFSFDQTLNGAFTPIPRTSINSAISKEQNFQMDSGMTDPETISRLGKQLGARFIVAGSITRLGSQQLMVIAIIRIDNLQQIAGEWRTYQDLSEIRRQLPDMAKNIVAASQKNTSRLQKLAILPFQMTSGDNEADALAQILAAEIIRTGTYAVFPRTKTLEQVQSEYKTQLNGGTDDYYIVDIGRGDNPLLALSGAARRLGQDRMFNAAIINVESGAQLKGESMDYQVIEDGPEAIKKLSRLLTGVYVIGDVGPAGGIIFYDKGNNTDGWRYLEVAPVNSEFTSDWNNARSRCINLKINGFTGWRLPREDELWLIQKNVYIKGQGNFGSNKYWSSSENTSYPNAASALPFNDNRMWLAKSKNSTYSVRAVRQF